MVYSGHMDDIVATLYRQEGQRVFSTLVRLLGSFDAAEDALHDAFVAAAEQWPAHGVPANPVAWLVSAGRFKAIDRISFCTPTSGKFGSLISPVFGSMPVVQLTFSPYCQTFSSLPLSLSITKTKPLLLRWTNTSLPLCGISSA
jgi:hypothetical protein